MRRSALRLHAQRGYAETSIKKLRALWVKSITRSGYEEEIAKVCEKRLGDAGPGPGLLSAQPGGAVEQRSTKSGTRAGTGDGTPPARQVNR